MTRQYVEQLERCGECRHNKIDRNNYQWCRHPATQSADGEDGRRIPPPYEEPAEWHEGFPVWCPLETYP